MDLTINTSQAELFLYFKNNPDHKTDTYIEVSVDDTIYKIPYFCITDVMGDMPDDFYPCDKEYWHKHPLYLTSVDMVKEAISTNKHKFAVFILY